MPLRRVLLAMAVVACALGARPCAAEPVVPLLLQNLVPARTLALASFEEVGTLGARFGKTALGKMLADPEMQPFAAPLREDLEKMMKGEGGSDLPVPPVFLKLLEHLTGLHGQAGIALVDMPEGSPVVAASLDFGGRLSEFVTFVQRIREEEGGADIPVVSEEKDGRTWLSVGEPGHPKLHGTAVGTALFLSTDTGWIGALAQSGAATVPGSLGASETFGRVRAQTGGDDLALSVYANVPGLLARLEMPDDARRTADALGLAQVEAAGYGMAFRGDGMLDSIVIDAPQASHGVLPALAMKPATRKTFDRAPATAFLAKESAFSLSTLGVHVRDIAGRMDPEALSEVKRFLREGKETLGVDIEQELLAGLSDDMGWWLALPETGGLYPELCVSLGVKDTVAYERTIEKAVEGILGQVGKDGRVSASRRVIEWHGKRLHVIDLAYVEGKKPLPFQPTICFVDGRMLVTLVPHAMKETLLRKEAGGAGLAGEEDVKALLGTAPEGAGGVSYLDLQAILGLLYDTGVPFLQTVAKPNVLGVPVRLDWAQLPAARSMRPYFRSMAAFTVCDGTSLRISIHSPVGIVIPTVILAVLTVALYTWTDGVEEGSSGVHLPSGSRLERSALAQMAGIAGAIDLWTIEHRTLPSSLEQLAEPSPRSGELYLTKLPVDPWGQDYRYLVVNPARRTYELRSAGADGRFSTADDVVYPEPDDK